MIKDHTKFPTTLIVLGVMSNEEDVIPPYLFPQDIRVNAVGNNEVLERTVRP